MSSFIQLAIALNNLPLSFCFSLSLTQVTDLWCGTETFRVYCNYDWKEIILRTSSFGGKAVPKWEDVINWHFLFWIVRPSCSLQQQELCSSGLLWCVCCSDSGHGQLSWTTECETSVRKTWGPIAFGGLGGVSPAGSSGVCQIVKNLSKWILRHYAEMKSFKKQPRCILEENHSGQI